MKNLRVVVVVILIFFSATARSESVICEGESIVGKWRWEKYIYQGVESPIPNPDLNLVFEFFPDGKDRVFWDRRGQRGFCERHGEYAFSGCRLKDRVTWINPKNAIDCGSDPDMKQGKETETQAEIRNGEFYLYFEVSGKPFVYVWKRIDEPAMENQGREKDSLNP